MLVTPTQNRKNRWAAILLAGLVAVGGIAISVAYRPALVLAALSGLVYWWLRRPCVHRSRVIQEPFPEQRERALMSHVEFFRALDDQGQERFRNLVKVFLDEVTITGIRTEADELTRTLVAASAVIPIFGFDDWEYSRLGEVLIYPNAFGGDYQTDEGAERNTLGMIGVNHLSGVMILSKPDLINGFANPGDKRNVGIHEFAHLVDKADGFVDGIPAGIPATTVRPWIDWVAAELSQRDDGSGHIDGYAYTNQAEYFAVLSEYFFEAPETLQRKSPETYAMLQSMYRQDTRSMLSGILPRRRKRVGRNSPCPCDSGKKFKRCCGTRRKRGTRASA
jgi:Mlc titration factor MtfA (ptsG expression regulator)